MTITLTSIDGHRARTTSPAADFEEISRILFEMISKHAPAAPLACDMELLAVAAHNKAAIQRRREHLAASDFPPQPPAPARTSDL